MKALLGCLLIGLGLTAASPARAQQPSPQDPPPPPPAGEPGPSTAPPVAVEVGPAQAPASDTPGPSASDPGKRPAARPWAGSSIYNQNSITTGTVFRGQQQYSNPTVESTLYLLPRYAISDAWQVRGRIIVSYEYTNSDSSTYRNEPLLSDTSLQLYYRKIPAFYGIQPLVAAGVAAPTSKLSRARTLVVNPSLSVQLSRPFEHVLGGEALLLGTLSYAHPFYASRNPEVADARPAGAFSCVGGNGCQDLLSGTMNPSDTLSYLLLFEMDWGKWSPAIMYLGASQWAYTPTATVNPVDGTTLKSPSGFGPTTVRQTHYVSAWLDYNFNSWFTGEVGFWNAVNAIDGNGQRANLVFDRYQGDTRVYLGCSIQLDNLAKTLSGAGEGEGGVIRTRNTKQPMFSF